MYKDYLKCYLLIVFVKNVKKNSYIYIYLIQNKNGKF